MSFAGDSVPPSLPPPPRRWWPWVLAVAAVFALLAAAVAWTQYRPFPTPEERAYFGWWYGSGTMDETHARAWIAEFREDGHLRIQFCSYHRASTDAAWQQTLSTEEGTWRVRDGVQHLASEDEANPPGWYLRYLRLRQEGGWRRQHYYQTTDINDHEMHYHALPDGQRFHSLHTRGRVALPDWPLPPERWPGAH